MYLRKDQSLDTLAKVGNVAQFVSFEPLKNQPLQAYSRVIGFSPNHKFAEPRLAIAALLAAAPSNTVNVRSYSPESPRSHEFLYGLSDIDAVMFAVHRLTSDGLYTIVNETIDVADGGVSGVIQNSIIEFAPNDTPRCVEKPGTASLPIEMGFALLKCVYGFAPDLGDATGRIEFSIHPKPRGWRKSHTLLWEQDEADQSQPAGSLKWPNRFSHHIGDKLYGLLMAHLAGLPVPHTVAIPRRIAPFTFGLETGSRETWLRTCPTEPQPGLFTTSRGWIDPYRLLNTEDPNGSSIASVIAQTGILACYAGATLIDAQGQTVVEGIAGTGEAFMLGSHPPENLPYPIIKDVLNACSRLMNVFGPIRTEWVHDGKQAWIVQLHQGATLTSSQTIVPGERSSWVDFNADCGLEGLRELLATIDPQSGIRIHGLIGMTSHIADIARKSGIPTKIIDK